MLTIATTSGVNFPPLEFEVLEQTHVVEVTRAAAECHYSCEQNKDKHYKLFYIKPLKFHKRQTRKFGFQIRHLKKKSSSNFKRALSANFYFSDKNQR